jgi:hypothetical protein
MWEIPQNKQENTMFKKIGLVMAVVVAAFVSTSANAQRVFPCPGMTPSGMCFAAPVHRNINRQRMDMRYQSSYRESAVYTERRNVSGPKLGLAADEFPVSGIRKGQHFDGVSDPDKAALCADRGGRLVAVFDTVMPNGQTRYRNDCQPLDGR